MPTQLDYLNSLLRFFDTIKNSEFTGERFQRNESASGGQGLFGCVIHHAYHKGELSPELVKIIRGTNWTWHDEKFQNAINKTYGEGAFFLFTEISRDCTEKDEFRPHFIKHIEKIKGVVRGEQFIINLPNGNRFTYTSIEEARATKEILSVAGITVKIVQIKEVEVK